MAAGILPAKKGKIIMARPKKVKVPFADVPEEFRNSIDSSTDEEINKKIAEVAKNDAALKEAKKADEDLKRLKEQVKVANEPYADAAKANAGRIGYARYVLSSRGKDAGDSGLDSPEPVSTGLQLVSVTADP